jgi:hypothetical protein
VNAPPERVWRFLIDPSLVVRCLPGAELTETIDERTYAGRVQVKVGAITTSYAGRAELVEMDPARRRMRLVGQGKEAAGTGSARLTMIGEVTPMPDGTSEVRVDATIDIVGRVMQFGRGLVESVSRQLFKQFAAALQTALESSEPAVAARAGSGHATAEKGGEGAESTIEASDTRRPAARASERELRILPLLYRALLDWLRRVFRR